jgi:hypothetical protein
MKMANSPNDETLRRARLETRTALGDLRHAMDVSPRDIEPDATAWKGIEDGLTALMAAAYLRNHNQ